MLFKIPENLLFTQVLELRATSDMKNNRFYYLSIMIRTFTLEVDF